MKSKFDGNCCMCLLISISTTGSLPKFADGIVQRKACVRGFASKDCCKKQIDIKVRNCFTYNVYYLSYTDLCYRAYCFGESEIIITHCRWIL